VVADVALGAADGADADAHTQKVLDQVDGNHSIRAAHASQVIALHVSAHSKVVDDHAGQAGGGAKDAAGGDNDVHIFWCQPCKHQVD